VGRRRHSVSCKASQFANTTTIEKAIHVIVAFKAEYLVSGALEESLLRSRQAPAAPGMIRKNRGEYRDEDPTGSNKFHVYDRSLLGGH
jgi:hypothetical protein